MPIRRYSNLAPPLPLLTGINTTAPTLTVSSTSGYPEPPFLLAIERGTPDEEVCRCTAKTGTTFTVERGYDDTTGKNHDPGDFVEHVHSAIEYRESKIPRLTTAERDALFANEIWEGRLIWNSTAGRFEYRDTQGPTDLWGDLLPTGVTVPFAGSAAPNTWLFCQGQLISRTDYSRLFAVIGTVFGAGDGSTTFAVPDLRRRFPLGRHTSSPYNTLGATGGAMDHAHTNPPSTSAGAHTHTQAATSSAGNHSHNNPSTAGSGVLQTGGAVKFTNPGGHVFDTGGPQAAEEHEHGISTHSHTVGDTGTTGAHTHTNPATSSTGAHTHNIGDTGVANPPYLVLNWIIRT